MLVMYLKTIKQVYQAIYPKKHSKNMHFRE